MKFSLVFLIALALSGVGNINAGPVRSSSELHDVLEEFIALVPQDKLVAVVFEYYYNDPEFQSVIKYMMSEPFQELVKKIESIPDVINFYDYLDESGLDIYGFVNEIHEAIGLPPLGPRNKLGNGTTRITGGVAGFYNDIKALLPIDKIKALYHEKLKTSPAFANLVKRLSSPRFQELVNALRANAEFRKIVVFFQEAGIDIKLITDLLTTMFGLEFPNQKPVQPTDLNDDLKDFLALLPVGKITEIAMDYLENDPEIKEAIEYLESPEFLQIVQEVEAMKETRDVLAFLQESGLDVYVFLNHLHGLLGIPSFQPSFLANERSSKASGGIPGLIADIKAILLIEDIKALYYSKLENSPTFARFIERLSSTEFHKLVDAFLAKEEARFIINKLKSHGVDLQAIADLLSTIIGLKLSKPVNARASDELRKDLDDFFDLLPLQEIVDVSVEYVYNDPEVQKAAEYVKSQEFKVLASNAQQNDEFRTFIAYLDESGLPAFEYINKINRHLAIPEVGPPKRFARSLISDPGVRGMLNAIEALLPEEAIKKMYAHKLLTSKAFVYFDQRLKAPEFQAVVDRLVQNKDFQKLGYRAAEFGIDLNAIVVFFWKVFGIEIAHELLP